MLHWYCKVTIILRKRKNDRETIIVRRREYLVSTFKRNPKHLTPKERAFDKHSILCMIQ